MSEYDNLIFFAPPCLRGHHFSHYKNFVDMLDEVAINDVKHYAVMDITEQEKNTLATHLSINQ